MLKIKDATGEVVGVLGDEDTAPQMKTSEGMKRLVEETEKLGLYDKELSSEDEEEGEKDAENAEVE